MSTKRERRMRKERSRRRRKRKGESERRGSGGGIVCFRFHIFPDGVTRPPHIVIEVMAAISVTVLLNSHAWFT